MKNKRFCRIILALISCVALLLSFTPALATNITTGTETASIVIDGVTAGDTFAAYKLVNATYNATTNEITYSFDDSVAPFFTGKSITVEAFLKYDDAQLKATMGELAAYVKAAAIDPYKTATAADTKATFTDMEMRMYLILGTGNTTSGAYIYQIMAASIAPTVSGNGYTIPETVALTAKKAEPAITKTVADETVAIGQDVPFTITATVPTYPAGATNTTYKIIDTLPIGLTFKSYAITYKNSEATVVTPAEGVCTVAEDGTTFTFDYAKLSAANVATIEITYTATATSALPYGTANTNTAVLTYSNDPYGTGTFTKEATATVYTYAIEVTKKGDETPIPSLLPGAVFSLSKDGMAITFAKGTDGYYYPSAAGTEVPTTDTNGKLFFRGLDEGAYTLTEVSAPAGYTMPANPSTTITLTADTDKTKLTSDTDAVYSVEIVNAKGFNLPQTGGTGTLLFTVIGIALMAGAVTMLLVLNKNRKKAK